MDSFFKKYFFSRKNISKLVLISIIAVTAYLFKDRLFLNSKFHIQAGYQQVLDVYEKGKVTFSSGRVLDVKNEYKVEEKISRDGSVITVHGRIDGNIDPVLSPIFNSRNYFTEIDLADVESACSAGFNPLYPVALRRLIYFMPEAELFDGQVWELNTCKGKFHCSYVLRFSDKKASVEILCSGSIGDSDVAVSGNLTVNKKLNGFDTVTLEITSSAPELVSVWTFSNAKK